MFVRFLKGSALLGCSAAMMGLGMLQWLTNPSGLKGISDLGSGRRGGVGMVLSAGAKMEGVICCIV